MGRGAGGHDRQGEWRPRAPGDDLADRPSSGCHPILADATSQQLPGLGGGEQVEGDGMGASATTRPDSSVRLVITTRHVELPGNQRGSMQALGGSVAKPRSEGGSKCVVGSDGLRSWLEDRQIGYVMAIPCNQELSTSAGGRRADTLTGLVPSTGWQWLSC